MMECGTIIRIPTFKGVRTSHAMCHDYRNCPKCQAVAAKGLARQLAKGEFTLVTRLPEKQAKKMIRRLGKGRYKRLPQSDGTVILFHDVLKEPGRPFEGGIPELKTMVQGIPTHKRISGHLGGVAAAATRPWMGFDQKHDDAAELVTINTHHFRIEGITEEETDALCLAAYEEAWEKTIKDMPLTTGLQVQQATNAVFYQVKKRVFARLLQFEMCTPATYVCDIVSTKEWKEVDTKRHLAGLPPPGGLHVNRAAA